MKIGTCDLQGYPPNFAKFDEVILINYQVIDGSRWIFGANITKMATIQMFNNGFLWKFTHVILKWWSMSVPILMKLS